MPRAERLEVAHPYFAHESSAADAGQPLPCALTTSFHMISLVRSRARPLTTTLAALALAGCGGDPILGPESRLPFTVSGTLVNRSGAAIPANARVLAVWGVSSGQPDYAYVFGEGTVDPATGGFSITFEQTPPAAALNAGELGIATLVLTTDASLAQGRMTTPFADGSILGATGRHAVIFLAVQPREATVDWSRRFTSGYGVGRGIDLPGAFDGFEPMRIDAVELIVDAIENIDVVNWT